MAKILNPIYFTNNKDEIALFREVQTGKMYWDLSWNDIGKLEIEYMHPESGNNLLFCNYGQAGWIGIVNNEWSVNAPNTGTISKVNVKIGKKEKVIISDISSTSTTKLNTYWDYAFTKRFYIFNVKIYNKQNQLIRDFVPVQTSSFSSYRMGTLKDKLSEKTLSVDQSYPFFIENRVRW